MNFRDIIYKPKTKVNAFKSKFYKKSKYKNRAKNRPISSLDAYRITIDNLHQQNRPHHA